jgi:hypothetical protein
MKRSYLCPFAVFPLGLVSVIALLGCEPSSSPSSGAPAGPGVFATSPVGDAVPGSSATSPAPDAGAPLPASERAWGPAVEISGRAPTALRGSPQVGIDASGNAVAVWLEALGDLSRNAVWASRRDAGGAWSTPATIDKPIGSASAPQLAMTAGGTALVAFAQSASNQGGAQLLVTNRFTGTWGIPTTASSPAQTPDKPSVALGADGAATLVFTAADSSFPRAWATQASATGSWDAPMVMDASAQPGWAPSVTMTTNGDAVMTWTETAGAFSETSLWASRNHGGTWGAPALLSADTGAVLGSILVGADASGDAIAIWSQRVAGPYTLRSARMSAGTGAWSAPVTVNDGTREVTAPQLSVDADGDAVAVWFETNHGIAASRFDSSTVAWGSPVVLQAKSTGLVFFPVPKVGMDAAGNAVATWVQPVGSPPQPHLFAAHASAAGGVWTAPVDLQSEPSATPYAGEMQLSVNAKGEAVVAWREEADASSAPGIWARVYR